MIKNYVKSSNSFFNLKRVLRSLILIISFAFTIPAIGQYCTPTSSQVQNYFINDFSLGTITNNGSSFQNNAPVGYNDFTSQSTVLTLGSTYSLYIGVGTASNQTHALGNSRYNIFIDYNNDNDFNDAGELVYHSTSNETSTFTYSLSIDANAPTGLHRLRIESRPYYIDSNPCASGNGAEIEDYTINIQGAGLPSAMDDSLTVEYNSVSSPSNTVDVSVNDFVGSTNGGDSDNYSILTSPLTTINGGTVTEGADGNFIYVPATDYVGTDSFDYQICDIAGICDTATVNVTVNPEILVTAPCFVNYGTNANHNINSVVIKDNLSGAVVLSNLNSGAATGVNGNSDYTAIVGNVIGGFDYDIEIDINQNSINDNSGYAVWLDSVSGNGAFELELGTINNNNNTSASQTLTFTMPSLAVGSYLLRVMMLRYNTPNGACQSITYAIGEAEDYTLTIAPGDDPVAFNDDLSVSIGNTGQVDVSVNDVIGTDGGDLDNYSISSSVLTTSNGGTVVEITDGVFEYTPDSGFLGSDSFEYTLCDALGDCDIATVNVVVDSGLCVPTSMTNQGAPWNYTYITGVTVSGDTQNINNTVGNGDDGGYGNYTNIAPADMSLGGTYTIDLDIFTGSNQTYGWAAYIDFNSNGAFDFGENIYRTALNGNNQRVEGTPFATQTFTIPTSVTPGIKVLRIGSRQWHASDTPCGNTGGASEEFEDYLIEIKPFVGPDISLQGDGVGIDNNDITTANANLTNFGTVDSNIGSQTHSFDIVNVGSGDLILGANAVVLSVGSDVSFTILNQPPVGVIASGASVSFEVVFEPRLIGQFNGVIEVISNDPDENPFTFSITGEGAQVYPDTDGDGVPDNVDIDDDNDGISDILEQNTCLTNPLATTADVVFLNETFGSGTNRVTIDGTTAGVRTSYCYEEGTAFQGANECDTEDNLNDGEYTVHYSVSNNNGIQEIGPGLPDISTWSEDVWYYGEDHTIGDVNGRMAIFNASVDPGVFYETEIVGSVAGATIDYSFYALNIDRQDSAFVNGELPRVLPSVTAIFYALDRTTVLATSPTFEINRCNSGVTNSCVLSEWIQISTSVTLSDSDFVIQLVNNAPGGFGNDLALDDIRISQSLCDLDGDGVADVVDLDNDNDGIPNIYEIGKPASLSVIDTNNDATSFGDATWIDSNENGMHDAYEGFTPIDTDNDNVPDYLDLDSDNDGLFDVLEYDSNGDLDVNGDGVGDGNDAGTIITNDNFDGDGLLAVLDLNDDDADNNDHGTFAFVLPLDTDGDGVADYLDIDSNDPLNDLSNGSDIDNSYYSHLDADNDGQIDFLLDVDMDGVSDGNGDLNTGLYGAPIDLDTDLFIDFDGRNDYIQTNDEVIGGRSSFTVFSWVLLDQAASGTSTVFSEKGMTMTISPFGSIKVVAQDNSGTDYTLFGFTQLAKNKWYNLSVRYDGPNGLCTLYINGVEEVSSAIANAPVATSVNNKFTIGKNYLDTTDNYFNGGIDEVRVFSKAIDKVAMEQMMYQEIQFIGGTIKGKIIERPFDNVTWNDLILYYDYNKIAEDQVFDKSSTGTDATMYNIKTILPQSAPLPYVTKQDGNLDVSTTYVQELVWSPSDLVVYPYSILNIKHNVLSSVSLQSSGLLIDAGAILTIEDGYKGDNKWYLRLDGTIDLLGDAQLIQTENSELDLLSIGKIKRRQEGKGDVYSYNYWGSPVGVQNSTSNNNDFSLDMLQDSHGFIQYTGTGVRTPSITQPATVSGRWLHTFMNGVSYTDWNRINATDNISVGHGWTQKGAGSSGDQEYIFEGKPNNGVINITAIDTDGDPTVDLTSSLLGNPYPSAIDARTFIDDNASVIDGAVYLWDQFRGTDHILANYEGGYATITKMATTRATQVEGSGALGGPITGTVVPTFFLPVAQGFFVTVRNSGTLTFNNGQRIFKKESAGESVFVSAPGAAQPVVDRSDYQDTTIDLLRLELEADNGASKEIVLGFADYLTDGIDYGYDGSMYDSPRESDLYTSFNGTNYVIKSYSEIQPSKVVPLTIHGETTISYKISAKEIAHIDANQELYLRDNELNTYHDLRNGDYFYNVSADGKDSTRFEIVFQTTTLGLDEQTLNQIDIYYLSNDGKVYVDHLPESLDYMNIYDLSGKILFSFRESELTNIQNGIAVPEISSGIYLVEIESQGTKKTVKIAVN